jgi:hypothetical protein
MTATSAVLALLALALPDEPLRIPPDNYTNGAFAKSVLWCAYEDVRAMAVGEIEKERRYSRIGGVVNLGRIEHWQRVAGRCGDVQEELAKELRDLGQRRLRCDNPGLRWIADCYELSFQSGAFAHHWSTDPACSSESHLLFRNLLGLKPLGER